MTVYRLQTLTLLIAIGCMKNVKEIKQNKLSLLPKVLDAVDACADMLQKRINELFNCIQLIVQQGHRQSAYAVR